FLSAPPVIADDQIQFLAYKSEIDGDARRGRVAIHVGQRLLDNAEQRLLKPKRKPVGVGARIPRDLQASPRAEPLNVSSERRRQSLTLQVWWIQEIGEGAELVCGFL